MKIIEYIVVCDYDEYLLANKVNAKIKAGYQPFGGVSITERKKIIDSLYFSQALVKYEDSALI